MSITTSPDETKNPSGARPTIPEGGTVPRPATIDLGLQARDGKLGQPVAPQPKPIPEMEKQQMNAYAQGFVQKCAEAGVDPQQLVKLATEDSRLMAYLSTLLPGGSGQYGWTEGDQGRGALQSRMAGLGGAALGGAGGGISGGVLGALIAALTKGKVNPLAGTGAGIGLGTLGGGFAGAGEAKYRAARQRR